MLNINLDEYIESIKVSMGGHVFTFTELGAINELSLIQMQARVEALSKKKNLTPEEDAELPELLQKLKETILGMFDDGKGGVVTQRLLGNMTHQNLKKLREKIVADYKESKKAAGNEQQNT